MPVDINHPRREQPVRHVSDKEPLARRAPVLHQAYRTGCRRARTATVVVKRCPDGQCRVEVPPWLMSEPWWRSGRRVWIAIRRGGVHISPKPSGPRGMKRCSRRVRRVPLTLTRRSSTSHMPCGQTLSERHAPRCMGIPGPTGSTSTREVAQ